MDFRVRVFSFLVSASLAFPGFSVASVIFKPGEKAKYVAPGDEEMSGKAEELFQIGHGRSATVKRLKSYIVTTHVYLHQLITL